MTGIDKSDAGLFRAFAIRAGFEPASLNPRQFRALYSFFRRRPRFEILCLAADILAAQARGAADIRSGIDVDKPGRDEPLQKAGPIASKAIRQLLAAGKIDGKLVKRRGGEILVDAFEAIKVRAALRDNGLDVEDISR